MIKKTGIVILFLLLLGLIPLCSAEESLDIAVTSTPINDKVYPGEWAEFSVTVNNKQNIADIFRLSIAEEGVEFSSLAEPMADLATGVQLEAFSSKTLTYKLKASDSLPRNAKKPYNVKLTAESTATKNTGSTTLQVFLLESQPVIIIYQSDINVSMNIPQRVDPRNIYSFKVDLVNNNPKDIKSLNVVLDSATIKKSAYVELEPNARKSVDFTVKFEDVTPMRDSLTVTVTEANMTLYQTVMPFEIVPYRIAFAAKRNITGGFLKRTEFITLVNDDIVESQQVFSVEKKLGDKYFTDTEPAARVAEQDGKRYYEWDVQLKPGETYTVIIISNYVLLLVIAAVIALIILAFILLKDPVTILKQAENVISRDGGINEIKVVLTVKNRRNTTFENVRVFDKIPRIAGLEKKHEEGTLHPSKVVQRADGSILQWNVDKLEGQEERIITYSFRSTLGIIGNLVLPPAKVVLKVGNDEKKIKSNELDVASPVEMSNPDYD